eukprot:899354-Lingulodinium_polyedra.AAC.1
MWTGPTPDTCPETVFRSEGLFYRRSTQPSTSSSSSKSSIQVSGSFQRISNAPGLKVLCNAPYFPNATAGSIMACGK